MKQTDWKPCPTNSCCKDSSKQTDWKPYPPNSCCKDSSKQTDWKPYPPNSCCKDSSKQTDWKPYPPNSCCKDSSKQTDWKPYPPNSCCKDSSKRREQFEKWTRQANNSEQTRPQGAVLVKRLRKLDHWSPRIGEVSCQGSSHSTNKVSRVGRGESDRVVRGAVEWHQGGVGSFPRRNIPDLMESPSLYHILWLSSRNLKSSKNRVKNHRATKAILLEATARYFIMMAIYLMS